MKNYDKDFIKEIILTVLAVAVIVIVAIILSILTIPFHAILLMLTWNYALTPLFSLPKIGFIQSICLVIISRILIKSGSATNVHNKKDD